MNDWRPFIYGGIASVAAESGRWCFIQMLIRLNFFLNNLLWIFWIFYSYFVGFKRKWLCFSMTFVLSQNLLEFIDAFKNDVFYLQEHFPLIQQKLVFRFKDRPSMSVLKKLSIGAWSMLWNAFMQKKECEHYIQGKQQLL